MDGLNAPVSHPNITHAEAQIPRFVSRRAPPPKPSAWQRLAKRLPLLLFVVLPTLLSAVYFFAFAAEQYVSEAKFVVRGAAGPSPGVLSTLLQGAGMSRAQDDTFAVQDYILSRDAMRELNKTVNLRALFARPEADVLSSFPLPYMSNTFEHLYKHYLTKVDVSYDSTTGVTALMVKGFRPEDAATIARGLLQAGERLVNRMNDRQRDNTMLDARREVALAEARVQKVAADLANFRNREALLDPNKQSVSLLQAITDMTNRVTAAKTQLGELSRSSPQSPLIQPIQRRITVMQGQIDEARSRITGSDQSMVPQITEFDSLTLQREFADREFSSAVSFLDTARLNAERQQLYLDEIVQPNEADWAAYPKRFADVAIVFATCFGLFTIGKLLVAGAREHRTS
jgi:capsular polysaccharide transport system permease protein